MPKAVFSGIVLTMLLASTLVLASGIQSVQESRTNGDLYGGSVAFAGEPDGFESPLGSTNWWPMFHHDLAHTGYSTSKAPSDNRTLWSYTTGSAVRSSPAVADGRVCVGSDDNKVYCLNASTGSFIWSYSTSSQVYSSPAVMDGRVYFGSSDKTVYCLNASTGSFIWGYVTGSAVLSSPAIADGKVYVGSFDNKVYCLNASTGAFLWSYTAGGPITYSSPAVAGGRVIVGSNDNKVYCLNASTGSFIWSYTTSDYVHSSPTVMDGRVYVGSTTIGKVHCLNASTGSLMWSYSIGRPVYSSPAVADGRVYVGSATIGRVYCLNASTGAFLWSYTAGGPITYSSPAVAGGRVYVGSDDSKVYCLNASTGSFIWGYVTGSAVLSSPAIADGKLYVGSNDKGVYAFGSHDVAVTSVTPSTTEVYSGQAVNITVVAENDGTFDETFSVQTYYDSTLIGTQTVVNLPQDEETTLTFSWDTTYVLGGYYTLSANATPVPGETDTADNNLIDGTVKVTSPVMLEEVVPCDQTGYPKDTFPRGTMAFFKVTINNTAAIPQNVLITINLYDELLIPIGVASFQGPILPGTSTTIFGLPIPAYAFQGTATVYANCYTDWPSQGGSPHCPEESATLAIVGP